MRWAVRVGWLLGVAALTALADGTCPADSALATRNRDLIDSYFYLFSIGNATALAALFAEDATGTYPPFPAMKIQGGVVSGRAALEQFYAQLIPAFSRRSARAVQVVMDPTGLTASTPLHFEGALVDGTPTVLDNINLWSFTPDAKIKSLRVYSGGGVKDDVNGQPPPSKLTVSVPDSSSRMVNATVCLPSDQKLQSPLLIYSHGWRVAGEDYDYLCRQLAGGVDGQNFVVAIIDTTLEDPAVQPPLLSPLARDAAVLVTALPKLEALRGRLTGRTLLAGHSMGGGTSVLAAPAIGGAVGGLALFAPGLYGNPNADATKVDTPTVVIVGANDCINDPTMPLRGIDTFRKLRSKKKALVVIKEANHCFWATPVEGACSYDICTSLPRLTQQAAGLKILQRFATALEGDTEWAAFEAFLAHGHDEQTGVEWEATATANGSSSVPSPSFPLCPSRCCSDALANMGLCKQ